MSLDFTAINPAAARADAASQSPSGDLPSRAQYVVVGGGVIGTSIAYHLALLGATDVVLLERKQLTSGTTWHAAGEVVSGGTTEDALWMARYSAELYARLEEETGLSTGFRQCGYLQLATTAARRREPAPRDGVHALGGDDQGGAVAARGGRPGAADAHRRRRPRLLDAGRGTGQPGRRDDVDGQGGPAARRADLREHRGHRLRPRSRAGGRRPHRARRHRVREGRARRGAVGSRAGGQGRRHRAAAGRRALLPAHRAHRRRHAGVGAGDRGRRGLRLLPRGGRRPAGRDVRAGREGLGAGRHPARQRVRRAAARLGADGAVPRGRDAALPGARGRGDPHALLRARELHRRPVADARRVPRGGRPLPRLRPQLGRHPLRRRPRPHDGAVADRGAPAARRHRGRRRPGPRVPGDPAVPRGAHRAAAGLPAQRPVLAERPERARAQRAPVAVPPPARRRRRPLRRHQRVGVPRLLRRAGCHPDRRVGLRARRGVRAHPRGAPPGPREARDLRPVADVAPPRAGTARDGRAQPGLRQRRRLRGRPGRLHAVARRPRRDHRRRHRHPAGRGHSTSWSAATPSTAGCRRGSAARRARASSSPSPT